MLYSLQFLQQFSNLLVIHANSSSLQLKVALPARGRE